eukprot:Skav215909  [mRNA]  locus=scaffold1542:190863:191786:- [translate_table: standard]
MHETGLVYISDHSSVGADEHQRQCEKGGQKSQLKRIAKTIFQMSVAMGLEPVVAAGEVLAVDSQQCPVPVDSPGAVASWMTWFGIFMVALLFAGLCGVLWWMRKKIKILLHDNYHMGNQLADHYEYDVELETRISMAEDMIETVRYGLMEHGGFVRFNELTGEQRQSMYVQERGNYVFWRLRQKEPENTDSPEIAGEEGEEEQAEEDLPESPEPVLQGISALMEHIREDQNEALRAEDWRAAAEIQRASMVILEHGDGSPDLTMEEVLVIRGIFQRLYRRTRNNSHFERAHKYQRYVDEMATLMNQV